LATIKPKFRRIFDLASLKDWPKRWLVKFNQNETEIMVFSTRDTKLYFNFDYEGASLRDVELHKHLGGPTDVSSANNLPKPVIPSAMSLINTKNNNGPKIDPSGTPALS
jgi:hypothetical protein